MNRYEKQWLMVLVTLIVTVATLFVIFCGFYLAFSAIEQNRPQKHQKEK